MRLFFAFASIDTRAHAGQLSRDAPLSHYSKDRLMSVRARAMSAEPDLAPLP